MFFLYTLDDLLYHSRDKVSEFYIFTLMNYEEEFYRFVQKEKGF